MNDAPPRPVAAPVAPAAIRPARLQAREPRATPAAKPLPRTWWVSRLLVFLTITILGTAADLYSKEAVFGWRGLPGERPVYWLWENYAGIQTAVNTGALFGLGAGMGRVFAAFSLVAAAGIAVWLFGYRAARSWWLTVAAAMILGGIAGNLYDRLGLWYEPGMDPAWQSGVRDWILLCYREYTWPNFNIADSLLVIGTGMLLWHSFATPVEEAAKATHAA